ncbi:hypothetical protein ABVF61_15460 [Roseibium sp. HPY-6]|uniref:hypothetical protein n=1 Tax=Roseibium sp. HPY-6 TaxID=3229852 RepID=UPI00338E34BE
MSSSSRFDVSTAEPPSDFSEPFKALWWLKKGVLTLGPEWEKAHEICQGAEGEPAHDWVHALCHLIEGDHGNAGYWFRMAGKPVQRDIEALWQDMAQSL